MYNIILPLFIFVCFLLIIAVLLQNGKGSDLGAALGGGSGEMFGPKAPANVMNKITTIIAACFIILSLTLAALSGRGNESIMKRVPVDINPSATTPIDSPVNTPIEPLTIPPVNNNAENVK